MEGQQGQMKIYRSLVYTSVETQPFGRRELEQLLAVSRQNNRKNGITGILLYCDGCFIQVLEGSEDQVFQTFMRVEKDPRHRSINQVIDVYGDERNFQDWSMGFRVIEKEQADRSIFPGFTNYLRTGRLNDELRRELPRKIKVFLDAFRVVSRL